MKQIYWGCWSLFIPSLFIEPGPAANIFPPTVSKLQISPSLQSDGPSVQGKQAGRVLLSRWCGPRGARRRWLGWLVLTSWCE